uniref:Secreted protein n=1 Tax=Clytia hemisphaerica TaxID=252671 RepID=A0A7M5X4E1_9CNID
MFRSKFVQAMIIVSIFFNGVFTEQIPSPDIEDDCSQEATNVCRSNQHVKVSTTAFWSCWLSKFNLCALPLKAMKISKWDLSRGSSGCSPQDKTVDVCYDDVDSVEICIPIVYEVLICL